ncbi:MAG: peptide-methionine (S)-S-oxide reductase MsrA [Clostridiales bacterium]|nr:peptide-methionine (S)-S-oxide reductase MsrA [Clostridiales bacterium]
MKKIVFAAGCFWGVEAYFKKINGILFVKVGYSNGRKDYPTYEEVCSGQTGHAETCYLEYDEAVISLSALLELYWKIVDPTVIDRQGPDVGSHYRTGIYYYDEVDYSVITSSKDAEQSKYELPIVTEIMPLKVFWDAEEYHQDYLDKNPSGYCHISF